MIIRVDLASSHAVGQLAGAVLLDAFGVGLFLLARRLWPKRT